jgi:hypothetical protein
MARTTSDSSSIFKGSDWAKKKWVIVFDNSVSAFGTQRLRRLPKGIPEFEYYVSGFMMILLIVFHGYKNKK